MLGIAVLLAALALPLEGVAQEEKEPSEWTVQELAEILRTQVPAPELTTRLLECKPLNRIVAMRSALDAARSEEILNVLGHMVRLGTLHRTQWEVLRWPLRSATYVQGIVAEVKRGPGPSPVGGVEDVTVTLSGAKLLTDGHGLSVENGAFRMIVVRRPDEWDSVRAWVGHERVLRVRQGQRGPTCYDHEWEPTGREREVFRQVGPLSTTDPKRLLELAGAADVDLSWLATAQIVMGCRKLGFGQWECWCRCLDRDYLEPRRSEIVKSFERLAPQLRWDGTRDAFVLAE